MDLLAVQRSLEGLQERFNDLQERFVDLVADRDVQAKEKAEVQHALEVCKQHQLEEQEVARQALEGLRKQLEQASVRLAEMKSEAKAASERSELALLQLHQVEEELEHYFLLSRQQAKLLTSSDDLFNRTALLTLKLSQ